MRRKINVSEHLLKSWKELYLHDIRNLIQPSLMKPEDLGTTFEHQDRHFEIIGMTIGGTLMLREMVNGESIYWECTRYFVQHKLRRFNLEFFKVNGKLQTREIGYPEVKLLLAPLNKRAKVQQTEEENDDINFNDEPEMEVFVEDNYKDEIDY